MGFEPMVQKIARIGIGYLLRGSPPFEPGKLLSKHTAQNIKKYQIKIFNSDTLVH